MILFLILVLHVCILWVLEFFPSPEFFIYPYLANHGWLPYKQILDHHFPGLFLTKLNFATFGINTPTLFHVVMSVVVVAQSLMIFSIGKKIAGRTAGLLSSGLFAFWQPFFGGNILWFDVFLPLFTLPALWFFINNNFLWVGLFLGFGILFKQSLAPLAFVVLVYILQRQRVGFVKYVVGLAIPASILLIYLFSNHIWNDFWYWTVTFNLTTYRLMGSLNPSVRHLIKLVPPGLMLLLSLYKNKSVYLKVLVAWMVFSVIAGLSRFDLQHIQPAIPYFVIILGTVMSTSNKWQRLVFIAISLVWTCISFFHQGHWGQTRYFDQVTLKLIQEVKKNTKEGEKIFLLGTQPHIYSFTKTFPPGGIFSFHLPWLLLVNQDKILTGLKNDPVKLVIVDESADIGVNGSKLLEYIQTNYHRVNSIGTNVIYYENRN